MAFWRRGCSEVSEVEDASMTFRSAVLIFLIAFLVPNVVPLKAPQNLLAGCSHWGAYDQRISYPEYFWLRG
jgi:hypothetical protein